MTDWQAAEDVLRDRMAGRRGPRFDLEQVLFGKQLAFVEDEATFATALCTRRAGKSVGVAAWLLDGPMHAPNPPSLYFTITRKEAKRIIWPVLLRMNREYDLGYEPNETDLVLKRGGVPLVFLMGVDTRDEIDKARGTGWGRVAGDEAQTLPQHVKEMVNDVLMPSFMDHNGKLRLIGTPGAIPVGYFFETTQNKAWRHHEWTVWENPHIRDAKKKLAEVLEARGVKEDDPSIQREWFGKWVYDPNALVFRWSAGCAMDAVPGGEWETVIGVDLGFDDADAIAVLGFAAGRPEAHLREEWVGSKQTITALAERLLALIAKYEPLSIVMDTGGLGKKIAEEIRARHAIPIKPAEKKDKFTHIELLNDAMRSGRFFAPAASRFAQDCMLVEWDKERSTGDRLVVSDRYHSDICDAVLYAFRESLHWLHEPNHAPPEDEEDEMEKLQEEMYRRQQEEGDVWG